MASICWQVMLAPAGHTGLPGLQALPRTKRVCAASAVIGAASVWFTRKKVPLSPTTKASWRLRTHTSKRISSLVGVLTSSQASSCLRSTTPPSPTTTTKSPRFSSVKPSMARRSTVVGTSSMTHSSSTRCRTVPSVPTAYTLPSARTTTSCSDSTSGNGCSSTQPGATSLSTVTGDGHRSSPRSSPSGTWLQTSLGSSQALATVKTARNTARAEPLRGAVMNKGMRLTRRLYQGWVVVRSLA